MRPIKFRVPHYSIKTGKFDHFSYWGTLDHKGEFSGGGSFTSPGSNSHTRKEWHEQFTGLLDKNGKEIYEGDIMRRNTGYVFLMEPIWFSLGGAGHAKAYGYNYHEDDEIIGNIHENSDLLK